MGLFNKLQQAFDNHVESLVSQQIQNRQEDIVRVVYDKLKHQLDRIELELSNTLSASSVDADIEKLKMRVHDLQQSVDNIDTDPYDTIESCIDRNFDFVERYDIEEMVQEGFHSTAFDEAVNDCIHQYIKGATFTTTIVEE